MSAERPLVTAIVTSYNHERYLPRAIESALSQDVEWLEVLVIDDASTDKSPQILDGLPRDPRLRIERHRENLGISRVFNRGLALARGRYVAYLGSDDFWLPGHLAGGLAPLVGTDVALSYGRVRVVDAEDRELPEQDLFDCSSDDDFFGAIAQRSNFVPFISVVMRRDVALSVGGFDERLDRLQDYDLWLRIAARHPVRFLDRTSAAFRWDGRNTSRRSLENSIGFRRELGMILEHWLSERGDELRRVGVERALRRRLAANYRRLGRRLDDPAEAIRCCRRSIALEPANPLSYSLMLKARLQSLRAHPSPRRADQRAP